MATSCTHGPWDLRRHDSDILIITLGGLVAVSALGQAPLSDADRACFKPATGASHMEMSGRELELEWSNLEEGGGRR